VTFVTRSQNLPNQAQQAYLNWIKQHILFHVEKHPQDMGASEVEASTQNQAIGALLFHYREVLHMQ
jgi:hypothetical protein